MKIKFSFPRTWLNAFKAVLQRLLQPKVETLMHDKLQGVEVKLLAAVKKSENNLEQQLGILRQENNNLQRQLEEKVAALRQLELTPAAPPDWQGRVHPGDTYLDFENIFRDTATIKQRQQRYWLLFAHQNNIVDLGCGRGEFLEMLRDHHGTATGIDISSAMINHCRQKGFTQVKQIGALDYLASQPDQSLGGIFSCHVIEHLPVEKLPEFFSLCWQKLSPDGVAVVETINPHCLAAFKHFWLDPTHVHLLFPELLEWQARASGFPTTEVRYLTETDFSLTEPSRWGNYALVAYATPPQNP